MLRACCAWVRTASWKSCGESTVIELVVGLALGGVEKVGNCAKVRDVMRKLEERQNKSR